MKLTIAAELKDALKADLDRLNKALETKARKTEGFLGDLLRYVLIGSGKRVRPALVVLASRLGKPNSEDVHVVAEAVELIHIATLIHDDVIDNAVLRRGLKTVSNEHGVDAAVLLGDHIYTYAFQRVAELGVPPLIQHMARSTSVMCAGEIEQLGMRFQFEITEAEYFSFIRKKTACLFGTSSRCGGILAGQPAEVQDALDSFGENLGMAFQITDDLLDLTGEEAVVGKTLRTDLANGKMTLPLIHFRDHLSAKDRKELIEGLRRPDAQVAPLVDKMKASGSIAYAEEVALRHVRSALDDLKKIPAGQPRDLMQALAEMLLKRKA